MAKVFIGMPTYNGERFIKEAIDSLRAQNYTDWIMLISDDASTDSTPTICREYAKKDPRITYHRQEENVGMFANFKFLLDKAHGDYFMWAAQDDLWEKDFLTVCIEHFEKNKNLGIVTTCMTEMDSFSRIVRELPWLTNLSGKPGFLKMARYALEPEILGKCNLMYGLFRTDALRATWKAYPQRMTWGQDYMFAIAALARFEVKVDERMLFRKRYGGFSNPNSNTTDTAEKIQRKEYGNPKNHMFPFGRFNIYLKGHMEALCGTPYQAIVAIMLTIRLPRAFIIYMKKRNISKKLKGIVKGTPLGKIYIYLKSEFIQKKNLRYITLKENLIISYQKKYNIKTFVETGTYRGDMINAMLRHFDSIYSVELGMELYHAAQERFRSEKKVHLLQGDSAEVVKDIERILTSPCIYWLDAHYSRGVTARANIDTPINDELKIILRDNLRSIILIDDARLFYGKDGYPVLSDLRESILNRYPNLVFKVSRDVIQIFPNIITHSVKNKMHSLISIPKRFLRKIKLWVDFVHDFKQFKKEALINDTRFIPTWKERYPFLHDKTPSTIVGGHYTYHPAWAARVVAKLMPKLHVDISSTTNFCIHVSAFVPVDFYDYRPANIVGLSNLNSKRGDLLALPFPDGSVESISCMHTVEHVGLGRYGDPIDPEGDLKAIEELKRVTQKGGTLIFVTPIGKPKIAYNAHRIYSYEQIISYFEGFELREFALIPDDAAETGIKINATKEESDKQNFGCGCFWFIKK